SDRVIESHELTQEDDTGSLVRGDVMRHDEQEVIRVAEMHQGAAQQHVAVKPKRTPRDVRHEPAPFFFTLTWGERCRPEIDDRELNLGYWSYDLDRSAVSDFDSGPQNVVPFDEHSQRLPQHVLIERCR